MEIEDLEATEPDIRENQAPGDKKAEDTKPEDTKGANSAKDKPDTDKQTDKVTDKKPDEKADKEADKEPDKEDNKKPDKEKEDETDLYKDDVYKDLDSSDEDMVFLDISGSEVKIAPSPEQEAAREKKKITINIDPEAFTAWLLVLLCGAVYVSLTFNNNVWLDEAFTASLVRTDMAGVIERSMADTLPPLYNIILKLTTDIFGYTVPVMKLTSAVPMILTMILGATVVRKRFGAFTSYLFIIALTVMPNMMFFGVEIRMYSLGFLFSTAAGIYVFEVICEPVKKNWIIFTLLSVLAGYSHHFAFVSVGFVYLFLLIYTLIEQKRFSSERDRELHPIILISFAKCLLATFILYLPCLLVTLKQLESVSGYFSMPDVTLPVFIKYCRYPFTVGLTPLSIALLALTLILALRLVLRIAGIHIPFLDAAQVDGTAEENLRNRDHFSLYCLILFYGVLLFGTLVSRIMTANIFVDRYLFFSLGLIWLFFSIEAGTLKKPLIYCIFIFMLVTGIYSYTQAYMSEYAPGANETIKWLEDNIQEGDSLYTLEDYEELAWCLTFYNSNLKNHETLDEALSAAGSGNVWVALMEGYKDEPASDLPSGNQGYEAYLEEMYEHGYSLEYEGTFRFDRYIFKMYKLTGM